MPNRPTGPTETRLPLLPWPTCLMCLASGSILALFVHYIGL